MKLIKSIANKLQFADMETRKTAVRKQKIYCKVPLRQDQIITGRQHAQNSRIYVVVEL